MVCCVFSLSVTCASDELFNRPLLFKMWITFSIILINLHPVDIAFLEPNTCWIVFYPVDIIYLSSV